MLGHYLKLHNHPFGPTAQQQPFNHLLRYYKPTVSQQQKRGTAFRNNAIPQTWQQHLNQCKLKNLMLPENIK